MYVAQVHLLPLVILRDMAPKCRDGKHAADHKAVTELRQTLKALKRRKERLAKTVVSVVPDHVQRMAVLIQMLSDDSRWAIAWVQKWQVQHYLVTFGTPVLPTHALILAWVEKHKTDADLLSILANIEHPKRIEADIFLIETLLFEFVQENSRKGISIPSSALVTRYLKLWSYRPVSTVVNTRLIELEQSSRHRKEWCRRFRKRWCILWGSIAVEKPQSHALLQKKVFNIIGNIHHSKHILWI